MLLQYLNQQPTKADAMLDDPLFERNVKPVHLRDRPSSSVGRSMNSKEPANMFAKIVRGPPIQAAAKLLARSITISHEDSANKSRKIKPEEKILAEEGSDLQSFKPAGPSYQGRKLEMNPRIMERVRASIDDIDSKNDPIFTIPVNTHKLVRKIAAELSSFDPAKIRQQKPVKNLKKIRAASVKPSQRQDNDPKSQEKANLSGKKGAEILPNGNNVYQSKRNNSITYEIPPERGENETIGQFIERRLNAAEKQQKSLWMPEQSLEEQEFQLKHFRTAKGIRVKRVRPRTASANPNPKSNQQPSFSQEPRPSSSKEQTRDYPDDPRTNETSVVHRRLRSFDSQAKEYQTDLLKQSTHTQSTTLGNNNTNTVSIQYEGLQGRGGTVVNVSTFLENSRPTSANLNSILSSFPISANVPNTLYSQKQRPATSSLTNRPNSANVNTTQIFMKGVPTTINQSFNVDSSMNRLLDATINPETTFVRPISSRTINEAEFALMGQNLLEEIPEDQSVKGEKISNGQKNLSDNRSSSRKESELDIEDLNESKTVKFQEIAIEQKPADVSQDKKDAVEQDAEKFKALLQQNKKKTGTQIPEKLVENALDFVNLMTIVRAKNRELQREYLADAAKDLEENGNEELEAGDMRLLADLETNLVRQSNLGQEEIVLKEFEVDKQELDEMKNKLEELQARWNSTVKDEEQFYEDRQHEAQRKGYVQDEALRGNAGRLTAHEVQYIRQEFKKPKKDIQIGQIDNIVSRLKFFVRMNKEVRVALLKEANHVFYKKGDTIFRMGDYGDLMYVILRGGCLVKVPQKNLNQGQLLTVASLYDGSHFGELAMIGTKTKNMNVIDLPEVKSLKEVPRAQEEERKKKMLRDQKLRQKRLDEENKKRKLTNMSLDSQERFDEVDAVEHEAIKEKNADLRQELGVQEDVQVSKGYVERTRRAATIEVAEDCDLLTINRDTFKELYVSILQKDIDSRIKIIMQLPFFRNEESFKIVPLANNFSSVTYKIGQRIIARGTVPRCLFLVASGRCKIIYEEVMTEQKIPRHSDKLKPFKYKSFVGEQTAKRLLEVKKENMLLTEECEEYHQNDYMRRTFDNERYASAENNRTVHHVPFKELRRGEMFGMRAILNQDDDETYMNDDKNIAKLTVIADSPSVEVYSLDRKYLIYIPDYVQNILKLGLGTMKEFDDYDIDKLRKEYADWVKMKHALMKQTLANNDNLQTGFHREYKAY